MSRPKLHLPVQALVCVAAFGFGLPLAIALFPQTSQVSHHFAVIVCFESWENRIPFIVY